MLLVKLKKKNVNCLHENAQSLRINSKGESIYKRPKQWTPSKTLSTQDLNDVLNNDKELTEL